MRLEDFVQNGITINRYHLHQDIACCILAFQAEHSNATRKNTLLIGIDNYDGTEHHKLNNAVSDLVKFKSIMENRYGFTIFKELYNQDATRAQIVDTLDSLCDDAPKDSDAIICYVGHGGRHRVANTGLWAPFGCQKSSDRIDNSSVYNSIQGMRVRHVLLISDSCFSGTCLPKILVKYFNSILNYIYLMIFNSYGRWVNHFFSIIKTEGTGLSPSLSEGLLVCLPLSNRQVLPPPSRFKASSQPRSTRI